VKFGAGFWGPFPLGRYVEHAVAAERLGFDCVGGSAVGTVGLTADGAAEFRRKLALVKALVAGETATVNGVEVRRSLDWDEHISAGAAHARPIPDEIARRFVFAGTAAEVAQMVRRLEGCGVTHVLALLMGSDIAGTLEAWSREIMPAWRTPSMAGR
jgi:alkanesulfonate monooxygenase SsuD/methylene tetrahydromethanopterin reductase-like flavin-dependent oxidoreductase (luciferase family)